MPKEKFTQALVLGPIVRALTPLGVAEEAINTLIPEHEEILEQLIHSPYKDLAIKLYHEHLSLEQLVLLLRAIHSFENSTACLVTMYQMLAFGFTFDHLLHIASNPDAMHNAMNHLAYNGLLLTYGFSHRDIIKLCTDNKDSYRIVKSHLGIVKHMYRWGQPLHTILYFLHKYPEEMQQTDRKTEAIIELMINDAVESSIIHNDQTYNWLFDHKETLYQLLENGHNLPTIISWLDEEFEHYSKILEDPNHPLLHQKEAAFVRGAICGALVESTPLPPELTFIVADHLPYKDGISASMTCKKAHHFAHAELSKIDTHFKHRVMEKRSSAGDESSRGL